MGDLVFPAHEAKELRDRPRERYEFALRYLPLPAAFREAAKGLRAIVRERKREDEPFEEPLRKLYRLACVENLVMTPDPSRGVRGFHLTERLPSELWEYAEFPYEEIGFEKLELLGVRDRSRMAKKWGEPEIHRNVREVLPEVWERFVEHHEAAERREEEQFQKRIQEIQSGASSGSGGSGCLVLLAVAAGGLTALLA